MTKKTTYQNAVRNLEGLKLELASELGSDSAITGNVNKKTSKKFEHPNNDRDTFNPS